jgi:hypothetical protein
MEKKSPDKNDNILNIITILAEIFFESEKTNFYTYFRRLGAYVYVPKQSDR